MIYQVWEFFPGKKKTKKTAHYDTRTHDAELDETLKTVAVVKLIFNYSRPLRLPMLFR